LLQVKRVFYVIHLYGDYHFGHAAIFLGGLLIEQSPALCDFAVEVRMREPASPSAQHPRHPHTHSHRHLPVCHRACCQLLREITLDEFMQINRLDDRLATAFFETQAEYVDFDGDGYISVDDLRFFVGMMLDYTRLEQKFSLIGSSFRLVDYSFTRGHAHLAVMIADRDGDGRLNMAEMQTLIDGSYMDGAMTTEFSTA
jgi:hypothetical protein